MSLPVPDILVSIGEISVEPLNVTKLIGWHSAPIP